MSVSWGPDALQGQGVWPSVSWDQGLGVWGPSDPSAPAVLSTGSTLIAKNELELLTPPPLHPWPGISSAAGFEC